MADTILKVLKMFLSFLKYPLYGIGGILVLWIFSVLTFIVIGLIKGRRFQRGQHKKAKKIPFLWKFFVQAPRQYVDDMFNMHPDSFPYKGLVIYTGPQGSGKTQSMIRDTMLMQKEYPLCKCITNLCYENEDDVLEHWSQLISYKNDIYGVIVCLDEIQNWFSSKQSKDFPPEMFEVITQNRKNRRIIMATTQGYYQVSKDIRCQCSEVRKCFTIAGVFTIVHRVRPILDSNGEVKSWKHIKFYCFAHTKEIRNAYDTYKVIESLMKSGFIERARSKD